MGQSPSDIRADIEETRTRVGDEVDALSYTDVPARVGDYVDDKKRALKDKVTGAKDAITGTGLGRRAERLQTPYQQFSATEQPTPCSVHHRASPGGVPAGSTRAPAPAR